MTARLEWWKSAVFYQIYPRSFQDSNGDGDGDLRGIEQRLDHLEWLGVGAVWITTMYESPHVDGGFDISNYERVDPRYGTNEDALALIDAIHRRGMKVIFGYVPNHTSDQHPWFRDSRTSRRSAHADWYLWCDERPNNWIDTLGSGAWQWCDERQQFYYHAYVPQQPDLNWRNRDVRNAMFDVMRYWLDRGVDGLRVDVLWRLIKDRLRRNDPPNTKFDPKEDPPWKRLEGVFSTNQPEVMDVLREMRSVTDAYDDRILIGELYVGISELMKYYRGGHGAQLPFNFELVVNPWSGPLLTSVISRYFGELPVHAWPNWVLGNHDQRRVATREGEDGARTGAVLLFTLGGTPFIYNGDEIGMRDADLDLAALDDPKASLAPKYARDPARTPMQWSSAHAAGFTTGKPWLPVARDFGERNVERQRADPKSMLNLYRDLIALRAREEAILTGDFLPLEPQGNFLAYIRASGSARFLIVANLGDADAFETNLRGTIEIATNRDRDGDEAGGRLDVGRREALVIRLK